MSANRIGKRGSIAAVLILIMIASGAGLILNWIAIGHDQEAGVAEIVNPEDDGAGGLLQYLAGEMYAAARKIQSTGCFETDAGKDYYSKGRTTAEYLIGRKPGSRDYDDGCEGTSVVEYYCQGGRFMKDVHECDLGCVDGACVCEYACSDSDGGAVSDSAGSISYRKNGVLAESYADVCVSSTELSEWHCDDDTTRPPAKEQQRCEFGCMDGACAQKPTGQREIEEALCAAKASEDSDVMVTRCAIGGVQRYTKYDATETRKETSLYDRNGSRICMIPQDPGCDSIIGDWLDCEGSIDVCNVTDCGQTDMDSLEGASEYAAEHDPGLTCFGEAILGGCRSAKLVLFEHETGGVEYTIRRLEPGKCMFHIEYGPAEQIGEDDIRSRAYEYMECPLGITGWAAEGQEFPVKPALVSYSSIMLMVLDPMFNPETECFGPLLARMAQNVTLYGD